MTSTRLPGKVLMEVMGRPLLSYQIERLRFSNRIDDIIIATTQNREDDIIADYAAQKSLTCYRGPENDVLSRYYRCAKAYGLDDIIRVTSDCPLIDPELVDILLEKYFQEKCDYIYLGPTFAEGLDIEAFSFKILKKAHINAKMMAEREHVTLYFHNNPELLKKVVLHNNLDDSRYRVTVDEPQDYQVVKAIIEALYDDRKMPFGFAEIREFLGKNPEIYRINSHIIRNEGLLMSLKKETRFCDSSSIVGAPR